MPNIVFLLLLHFLYLCYYINCFVTSSVSKDTYFIQHEYQGINLQLAIVLASVKKAT